MISKRINEVKCGSKLLNGERLKTYPFNCLMMMRDRPIYAPHLMIVIHMTE